MIDKRLLRDELSVQKVATKDDFGDVAYEDLLTIKHVRFDRSVGVSGSDNGKIRQKVGVIYLYPKITKVIVDDSWLGAKVSDGQRDYTVTGFQANYLNGTVFSYEIEVV